VVSHPSAKSAEGWGTWLGLAARLHLQRNPKTARRFTSRQHWDVFLAEAQRYFWKALLSVLGQIHPEIMRLGVELRGLKAERITKVKLGEDVVECRRV